MKNTQRKKCPRCNETKTKDDFYVVKSGKQKGDLSSYCIKCTLEASLANKHLHGTTPISEAKECGLWLGVVIAERVLSNYFNNITRMKHGNKGFDYICEHGYKIDVKCACQEIRKDHRPRWSFSIRKNKTANYFLMLALNNTIGDRQNLEPAHIWLIKGDVINQYTRISVTNTPRGITKWSQYERPLDKVIECCNIMREEVKA